MMLNPKKIRIIPATIFPSEKRVMIPQIHEVMGMIARITLTITQTKIIAFLSHFSNSFYYIYSIVIFYILYAEMSRVLPKIIKICVGFTNFHA